jgi:hypothetical protein
VTIQTFNCEQNSPEWHEARRGIVTASQFATVLAKSKDGGVSLTRKTYMLKVAGEIITGEPAENYSNEYMERGHAMEDEARDLYAFQTGATLQRVGFVRNGRAGCSPDSLIGEDGGLEIKTKAPHLLIELILKNEFPPEHKAQVQGTLWITGRQWWDLWVYYRNMPPFKIRVQRDEPYIQTLATAVDRFNAELDAVVAKIRARGEAVAA